MIFRMQNLVRYFLRGLAVVVPIAVTVWVIYELVTGLDRLIGARYPGLGLLITLAAIFLTGVAVSNFIGRSLLRFTELLFARAPFIKIVYTSVKDLVEAFVGDKRRFDRPVSVSLSEDGSLRALGFVTRDDLAYLGAPGFAAVYFPQSYNFAGNLILVERSRVLQVEADSSQVMAFIVSGGVSEGRGSQ